MCIFDHMVDQDSIRKQEELKGREVQAEPPILSQILQRIL